MSSRVGVHTQVKEIAAIMQTLKKLGEQTGLSPKPPSYKCRAKSEFKTTNNYLEFSFPHSVLVFFGGVGGREQDPRNGFPGSKSQGCPE